MMMGSHHTIDTCMKISNAVKGTKNHNYGRPRTEETRAKISAAHIGKRHSIESRAKMSIAKQNMSDETRMKMSVARKGRSLSDETRKKMSAAQKKRKPIQIFEELPANISVARAGRTLSEETRVKISIARKGWSPSEETRAKMSVSHRGMATEDHPMYGKKHSAEARAKMSAAHIGKNKGENNSQWKGGISFEPYCPKFNENFKKRARAFFGHRCTMCGKTEIENGQRLSVHHVEYDKSACCHDKPVTFAALCSKCHNKTTHGDRRRWEDMLHRVIDEIWDGRSYFTKEEYAGMVL